MLTWSPFVTAHLTTILPAMLELFKEAARLRSLAATFTPELYTELLATNQDLEFPFDDTAGLDRERDFHETHYKTIPGHFPGATRLRNIEEKIYQTALMGRIYSQAQEVIAWLGESEKNSESIASEAKAMSLLKMETSFDSDLNSYTDTWGPVDASFSRNIWSRIWVIREFVVAAKLTVMCGQYASSFDNWHGVRDLRREKLSLERRLPRLVSYENFKADEAAWDAVIALQPLRDRYRKNDRMELELATLLFLSRRHISSEYRDKLYALLSLLGDKERSDPFFHPD
ncbi:hypothetical protein EAE99_000756 [Botrytis elliptica]|nr:hypothetical protein EAE99_000756 [Botrytis elliptica]